MGEHVTLKWLGNSCFLVTSKSGLRILIDPFSARWAREDRYGLREPRIAADVVLVTHEDPDHNALDIVPGSFVVVRGDAPEREVLGVKVRSFSTIHGTVDGTIVKDNTVFSFVVDGLTFCHMGDFFAYRHREQPLVLTGADVLMIPVGGRYSLDWGGAWETIATLKPRIAVPMHYDEFGKRPSVLSVEGFVKDRQNVTRIDGSTLELSPQIFDGPGPKLCVLTYE